MKTRHLWLCMVCTLLTWMAALTVRATIVDGGEYYIVNDYYGMVLGVGDDMSKPRLTPAGTNGDAATYVVVAETSGTAGWWLLRNKRTGRYLMAATQDSWSVSWSESRGTGNEYLWQLDVRFGGRITSKKATDKRLGCDWNETESVPVYYDKPASSRARWSVFPAVAEGYEASLLQAETEVFTNAQGRLEKDYWQVASVVDVEDAIDVHLAGDVPFATTGRLNLVNTDAWVVFDHVSPSEVIASYLRYIKINNRPASVGSNVRVAIWLDGAAVIPCRPSETAMTGYTETGLSGREVRLGNRNTATMGTNSNAIRSFVLKRGYMATLASGENGKGYSRVYVADHADVVVENLPEQLDRRISSVNIRPWQYVGKKGWCSTQKTESIVDQMGRLHATWFYTWSADRETTSDQEYVPIRQHLYWPSLAQINGLTASTHVLSFNEPEHAEQHSSNKCDCGGVIDSWKATTLTPDLQESGMRIGSPAPTDMSWLYEYIGHCDDMTYRCDFVAIHAYWGPNEADGASAWYNKLKEIYETTHRPIWITEWAYGASWTKESWPSNYSEQLEKNRAAIMDIVDMLERCPYVERYSYYQWDTSSRRFINDDGWMTPAGRVYRDTQSTFAYNADMQKIPHWWRPSAKSSTLDFSINRETQQVIFTLGNPNGDCTDEFVLERITADGTMEEITNKTNTRYSLENTTLTARVPLADVDRWSDTFRVRSTTLFGANTSSVAVGLGFLQNTDAEDGTNHWTASTLSTNSGEAWDGNANNVYWDQWKANGLSSSLSQELYCVEDGRYSLCALVRASSNVSITMTVRILHADGTEETVEAAEQGRGNKTLADSPWQNGWMFLTLPAFTAQASDTVTLTLKASGSGSAWWSADHVTVGFTPAQPDCVEAVNSEDLKDKVEGVYDLSGRILPNSSFERGGARRAEGYKGIYIQNGKKTINN
ncbi:MAG: glycoside hydrolase family protein [Bacteroidaceae bacterium]|nr:glycoside hydrolase family protein [Bacteroidaceae bacterium]